MVDALLMAESPGPWPYLSSSWSSSLALVSLAAAAVGFLGRLTEDVGQQLPANAAQPGYRVEGEAVQEPDHIRTLQDKVLHMGCNIGKNLATRNPGVNHKHSLRT